ncbi:hypothetical protein [Streptomyces sp. st170]|uniref:hypothetical protein n=1 Tax=Streptomyces sp. st170 TaxID=1828058 RepID=UPI000BF11571|nr:hypothetical protein [Streptomyces sp. st170]
MATAARSKAPARRKPARARSTAPANKTTASIVVPALPEADPVVADARDRAADILDLAADRVLDLDAAASAAEQHLGTVRQEVEQLFAEKAGLAEQHERMRTGTTQQLAQAEEIARRISDLTAGRLTAAEEAVTAHRAEAEQILAEARRQAEDVADRLLDDARRQAQALTAAAEADRTAAVRERQAAEAELTRAHERSSALAVAADEQLVACRAQAEALHREAAEATDRTRARTAAYADAQRQAAEKAASVIRATAEQLAARTRREAREAADTILGEASSTLTQARADADRLRGEAAGEADRLRTDAQRAAVAARTKGEQAAAQAVTAARHEATVIKRDAALLRALAERELEAAEAERAASTGEGTPVKVRQSPVVWLWGKAPWAALIAAIGLTASGEYELARLAGFGIVSWLLPVCIDIWAATAFHRKKDVKAALAMMIGTNVLYHMAERGILGIRTVDGRPLIIDGHPAAEWWLIGLVACIAPVVLWRVHHLIGHPTDTPDAPAPDAHPAPPHRTLSAPAHLTASPGVQSTVRTAQDATGHLPTGTGTGTVPDARTPAATSGNGRTAAAGSPARTVGAARARVTVTESTSGPRPVGRPAPSQGVTVRSDEELIAMIRTMPTDPDGCLPPTRVREHLGCRTGRAVRLMRIVGVLRPEDDPELTTAPRTS